MTTREIYFKAYMLSTLKAGMVFYTYKDPKGIIQLGESLWLSFSQDCHEDNIEAMKKIEKRLGFMFWNLSDTGEQFFQKQGGKISEHFANLVMMQK